LLTWTVPNEAACVNWLALPKGPCLILWSELGQWGAGRGGESPATLRRQQSSAWQATTTVCARFYSQAVHLVNDGVEVGWRSSSSTSVY